jgi:hypothetical protein
MHDQSLQQPPGFGTSACLHGRCWALSVFSQHWLKSASVRGMGWQLRQQAV